MLRFDTLDNFFLQTDSQGQFTAEIEETCKLGFPILRDYVFYQEAYPNLKKNLWTNLKQFPVEDLIESGNMIGKNDQLKTLYRLTSFVVNDKTKKISKAIDDITTFFSSPDKKTLDKKNSTHIAAIAIVHFPYLQSSELKEKLLIIRLVIGCVDLLFKSKFVDKIIIFRSTF